MGQNKLHEQSIRTSSALSTTPGPQVRPGSLTWQAHARICNFTGNDAKVILCIGRSRSISSEWPIKIIPVTSRLFLTAFARPGRDDRCNKCVQPARATRKQRCMYQSTPHISVQCLLSPSEYDSKSIAACMIHRTPQAQHRFSLCPAMPVGKSERVMRSWRPQQFHACGHLSKSLLQEA